MNWTTLLESAIKKPTERPKGGKTFKELVKEQSLPPTTVRRALNSLKKDGKLTVVKGSEYNEELKRSTQQVWYVLNKK